MIIKKSILLKYIKYIVICDDNENLFKNINMYIGSYAVAKKLYREE